MPAIIEHDLHPHRLTFNERVEVFFQIPDLGAHFDVSRLR